MEAPKSSEKPDVPARAAPSITMAVPKMIVTTQAAQEETKDVPKPTEKDTISTKTTTTMATT